LMPIVAVGSPKATPLHKCIKSWKSRVKAASKVRAAWNRFRGSDCGREWYAALLAAYGKRCVYCDHSPAHTIDHRGATAGAKGRGRVLAWTNWAPCCGDCNRLKGTSRGLVDPFREDPRKYLAFGPLTGAPQVRPGANGAGRKKGLRTIGVLRLGHEVLNDGRRTTCRSLVRALKDYVQEPRAASRANVCRESEAAPPHRAALRDLILTPAEAGPYEPIVAAALTLFPELRTWAENPNGVDVSAMAADGG